MQRILALFATLFASGAAVSFAQAPNKWGDLAKIQIPGAKLEITRAEMVAAGQAPAGRGGAAGPLLPAHCRVNGILDRRTGPDGKTYGIRFAERVQFWAQHREQPLKSTNFISLHFK